MNINYKLLNKICLAKTQDFKSLGKVTSTVDGIHIYKDNDSKILGVAHLDTVLDSKSFRTGKYKGKEYVFNAQLDDRLGVYTLLSLLPSLGINFDVLLTEGEETGRSTAQYFETNKQYNWVFSFDRRGEDVVSYQYEDNEWNNTLRQSGFTPALGSFSDIAFLDHLGIKAVNIGTGYYGEHTKTSYADIDVLKHQVSRFAEFYKANKDIKYPHIPQPATPYRFGGRYNWDDWGEYDSFYCYLCNERMGITEVTSGIWVCEECVSDCDICPSCQEVVYSHEIFNGMCSDCQQTKWYYQEDYDG